MLQSKKIERCNKLNIDNKSIHFKDGISCNLCILLWYWVKLSDNCNWSWSHFDESNFHDLNNLQNMSLTQTNFASQLVEFVPNSSLLVKLPIIVSPNVKTKKRDAIKPTPLCVFYSWAWVSKCIVPGKCYWPALHYSQNSNVQT